MEDVQFSVESSAGAARRIRVQVAAARIEREVEARLQSVARTANLKGFRPGKVPQGMIRQRFGANARREVIQNLVQGSYAEAVAREKLRPVGDPRIEMTQDPDARGADLIFTLSFDIFPQFDVQGLRDIAVTRPELIVDDADMDFVIEDLRRQRGTVGPVDEEFIRSFDVPSGNFDEFLQRIREYMRDEFESRARADVKRQLLDLLLRENPISVPAVLVDKEAALSPDSSRETAERRVRLSLVCGAIIREQRLVIDRERVRARVEELASNHERPDEIRNLYYKTPALLAQVEEQAMDEQLIQWLTERATVTPIPTNFRSLKGR